MSKKKKYNKFIRLSGVGFQMGATIFLAAYFGKKLDAKYQTEKPWFTLLLVLFGFIASMYSLIKQLNKINKNEQE